MGKKLYRPTPGGGIKFISHRMGEVRTPNYVYDIWSPLLGGNAIHLYNIYCRLEREGTVKAITQEDLARACRMGKATLRRINDTLQECGFIKITPPTGHQRLMHWTVTIEVFDPPTSISAELMQKYKPKYGYQALSKWLVEDGEDEGVSENEDTTQECDTEASEVLNRTPQVLNRTPSRTKQNPQDCIPCSLNTLEDIPAQNDARVSAEPEPVTDAPPQKRKKRKKGKQELPFPEDHKAIVRVLADATGIDLAVCPVAERGRLNKASGIFRRGGYRIGDVRAIVRHWRERDWRGKKGNIPTLEQLRNHAGVWRKEHRAKERERKEVEARHAEAWAKHDAMERRRAAQNAKVQQEIADWKAQQQQQRKEIAHHGPT